MLKLMTVYRFSVYQQFYDPGLLEGHPVSFPAAPDKALDMLGVQWSRPKKSPQSENRELMIFALTTSEWRQPLESRCRDHGCIIKHVHL